MTASLCRLQRCDRRCRNPCRSSPASRPLQRFGENSSPHGGRASTVFSTYWRKNGTAERRSCCFQVTVPFQPARQNHGPLLPRRVRGNPGSEQFSASLRQIGYPVERDRDSKPAWTTSGRCLQIHQGGLQDTVLPRLEEYRPESGQIPLRRRISRQGSRSRGEAGLP